MAVNYQPCLCISFNQTDSGLSACTNMSLTSIYCVKLKWSGEFDSKFGLTLFREVVFYLNKTYESVIAHIDYVDKEDLDLVNHLSGAT